MEAVARGMVDISRLWSRPSLERMAEGGGADWDIEVESQDSPVGIDGVGGVDVDVRGICWVVAAVWRACASQASRVLWSTGQASAFEASAFGFIGCGGCGSGCEGVGGLEPSRLFVLPIVTTGMDR